MLSHRINGHSNRNELSASRWNKIIILDQNKNPIQDQIYHLDNKARLLTKLKRQRRRDLGKVTGKKKVPKNWKQIIENLDDPSFSSLHIINDQIDMAIDVPSEPTSSASLSSSEQETQQFDTLSFDKLISIDWLLNQPTELSEVLS